MTGVVADQPAIAVKVITRIKDSASQASFTLLSAAEIWRSDPGCQVDGISDQRRAYSMLVACGLAFEILAIYYNFLVMQYDFHMSFQDFL